MPRRARRTREKKWGRIMNAISPKALEELEHNLALLAQAGVRPAQEDFPTRYLGKWGEDAAGNLHALLMELGDSDETPDGPRRRRGSTGWTRSAWTTRWPMSTLCRGWARWWPTGRR